MAQNFLPCDRDQELLLPPSLREWLPEDHLAWFVLEHHLPDAQEEIELHLRLLPTQRVRERDLDQIPPLDPLAPTLAPAQEVKEVVRQVWIAEPQTDSHRRR